MALEAGSTETGSAGASEALAAPPTGELAPPAGPAEDPAEG
jgi:hypothetical protein